MGLPVVIFRLFNTVSPRQTGQYGMVVPRFVGQALRGEPLTVYGDGGQTRCFCDVKDAVRAIIGLAECPEAVGQVFNVGSTEEVTILDLARKVLALVDDAQGSKGAGERRSGGARENSPLHPSTSAPRLRFVPYEEAYEAGFEDMRRRVPDIGKIRSLVGYRPTVTLDEIVVRVIEHVRAHGRP